jgi:hypothetical protein
MPHTPDLYACVSFPGNKSFFTSASLYTYILIGGETSSLIDSSARDGLAVKTSRQVPKGIEDIPNWFDDDDDDDDESDELFFAETKPTPPFKVSSMLVTFARRQNRQIALRGEEERKRDGVPSLVFLLFRRRSRCRFFSIIITLSVCDSFFLFCVSSPA